MTSVAEALDPAVRRWARALAETAGMAAAFLAVGLGYGALVARAPAAATGYVAERAVAREEPPAHVAARTRWREPDPSVAGSPLR